MAQVEAHTERPQSARRERAIAGVRLAIEDLRSLGVEALVIGSLAKETFGPFSDVDILVTECPLDLKYSIEGKVEDRLGDIPFDLIYLDEIPPYKIASFKDGAVDADRLR